MRRALLVVLLLAVSAWAKDKIKVQHAPLPSQVVTAKKVFIAKGMGATARTVEGGFDIAFDAFYSEIKKWGRYDVVGSPDEAELVFEVTYTVENGGTHVWSSTNTYNGTTQVHSAQLINAQLTVVLLDARSKTELWSSAVVPGKAFLKSNQEKEMAKAGEKLASNVEQRVDSSTAVRTSENGALCGRQIIWDINHESQQGGRYQAVRS